MGQPYMVDTVKLFCVFSFFQIGTTVQIRDYIYYTRVKVAFGDLMLGPSHIAPGPAKKVRKFNVTNF